MSQSIKPFETEAIRAILQKATEANQAVGEYAGFLIQKYGLDPRRFALAPNLCEFVEIPQPPAPPAKLADSANAPAPNPKTEEASAAPESEKETIQ